LRIESLLNPLVSRFLIGASLSILSSSTKFSVIWDQKGYSSLGTSALCKHFINHTHSIVLLGALVLYWENYQNLSEETGRLKWPAFDRDISQESHQEWKKC
jgi:hypothetical protein